jgi:hypothetical protein
MEDYLTMRLYVSNFGSLAFYDLELNTASRRTPVDCGEQGGSENIDRIIFP